MTDILFFNEFICLWIEYKLTIPWNSQISRPKTEHINRIINQFCIYNIC